MQIQNATIYWAKVLGKPVKGFDEGSLEWSFDISVDNATIDGEPAVEVLTKAGLKTRIKNKDDEKGNFLHLKRNAVKKDGEPAKPIAVVDNQNATWNDEILIGNGSIVNVNVLVQEYGDKKKPKMTLRPMAIQVWEHVGYSGKSTFPTKEVSGDESAEETSDKADW